MDVEKLISLVKERRPLWDNEIKDYNNRMLVKKLWSQVAIELNEPYAIVKNKWKNLRDNFRREYFKQDFADKQGSGRRKWTHLKSLKFLQSSISRRLLIEDVSDASLRSDSNESDYHPEDEIKVEDVPEGRTSPLKAHEAAEKAASLSPKASGEMVLASAEPLTPKQFQRAEADMEREFANKHLELMADGDYHFLMSMLPEMKKVPEHRRFCLRIKLQQALLEEQQHV